MTAASFVYVYILYDSTANALLFSLHRQVRSYYIVVLAQRVVLFYFSHPPPILNCIYSHQLPSIFVLFHFILLISKSTHLNSTQLKSNRINSKSEQSWGPSQQTTSSSSTSLCPSPIPSSPPSQSASPSCASTTKSPPSSTTA